MQHHLSSNITLILRLFLPIVWLVFFGAFMIAGWITVEDIIGPFQKNIYRLTTTGFFLGGLIFIWFTFWRLYRVEGNEAYIYVSNYFRTVRYDRESIDHIRLHHFGIFQLCKITLRGKGRFGQRIWFLPSRKRLEHFILETPSWDIKNA